MDRICECVSISVIVVNLMTVPMERERTQIEAQNMLDHIIVVYRCALHLRLTVNNKLKQSVVNTHHTRSMQVSY